MQPVAYLGQLLKAEIEFFGVEFLNIPLYLSKPYYRQKPALYHRFRHSVASITSSLSLFRFRKIVSFVPLKIRSVSALIAGIDSISNAIEASWGEPEFSYYLKRLMSYSKAIDELLR
jgi:hypothetical protein